jgi:ATP-dependent Clp protease ATP-binding subunit ClpC
MFERYAETARAAIFAARYEARQFGSEHIEPGHLLLGILRSDGPLALRLLKAPEKIESIREHIERQFSRQEKVSTSVDLPLSLECKRVLAYGAEEAERFNHKHIAAEHLLLGLLREEKSATSKIMVDNGLTASQLKQEVSRISPASTPGAGPAHVSSLTAGSRDLTAAARNGALNPLIGRERELDRTIQILSRRTKSNPVLIGEPGVGKNALVHGLAQRIADGVVPATLAERPILAIDASSLISFLHGGRETAPLLPDEAIGTRGVTANLPEITNRANAILYVQGLFDLAGKGAGWGVFEAIQGLEPQLAHGGLQCIASGTPFGLRLTLERAGTLASHFEVVSVLPPNEEEAIQIVSGVREQYEKFHGVVVTNEAIETAVSASRWFLRHRHLPDRAIDLIDEAGARVGLRCKSEPREIIEIRKRIRLSTRQMENSIANHEFDKARLHSDEERKDRQNLQRLCEELKQNPQSNILTPEDIVEAVAGLTGVTVSVVKSVLRVKEVEQLELITKELAAQISVGGREWTEGLAAYLTGCSAEEAEKLAQAIRAAKAKIDLQ